MRKPATILFLLICFTLAANAQTDQRPKKQKPAAMKQRAAGKKYPSLLWEITGNGLKKPSFLFGTMHVSDKLAFHLGDSFYNAIKSVQMVALETNPEHWQEDYSRSVFYRSSRRGAGPGRTYFSGTRFENDYMQISTFAVDTYEEKIKAALAVEPSMINGMLYRTYGDQQGDFEEDTFLDMYIFQVGKKLGKRLNGVEDFRESEKLVMEAYRDMLRDRQTKKRSFDYESMLTNPKKVEDAYRRGDLDLLDSLESLTIFSEAFQEKFLYKRNEIQAHSIDTILRRHSLFVGVGAAHLPGPRGVIELLRQKGYTLRPVKMDDRSSVQKEMIEKILVDKEFKLQTSDDGFFKVAIPGEKFYRFTEWNGMDMVQFADMVNGAYYMVTRIKTNSHFLGHNSEAVYRKIDSLLYENVPGKILKRSTVTRNGYKGFDFTNRTRRGDYQRYQVFVTPFEIIVFKMSGNGAYINVSNATAKFFGSIELKAYTGGIWQSWQPATGGFRADWPHTPALLHDNSFGTDRLEYAARDEQDGNSYLVMQANLHNYSFLEEDTFELALMEESYRFSPFITQLLERRFTTVNGYPALESRYRHKDGSYSAVRYVIRGPVYYTVVAKYRRPNDHVQRFLKSFAVVPYIYHEAKEYTDTALHFTVKTPVLPPDSSGEETIEDLEDIYRMAFTEDSVSRSVYPGYESKVLANDTTGEKIWITWYRPGKYDQWKDTTEWWKGGLRDSTYIRRLDTNYVLPGRMRVREQHFTDTGSSRMLLSKTFYKNGNFFGIYSLTDTATNGSAFIRSFFGSFQPSDSLRGMSAGKRTSQLFKDLFSKDSLVTDAARRYLHLYKFDSSDAPLIKNAIASLHWGMAGYLDTKSALIAEMGKLKDSSVTTWLQELYWKVKDTVALQNAILHSLMVQRTRASFMAFRDLIVQEPPIVDNELYNYNDYSLNANSEFVATDIVTTAYDTESRQTYRGPWYALYDTLTLTKDIFPGFLQLLLVDDYHDAVLDLLSVLVDSGYLKATHYEQYFSKIYVDGKQTLKKQKAKEDKARMELAAKKDRLVPAYYNMYYEDEDGHYDFGNNDLDRYAVLLLPFRDKNPGVKQFFEQLMQTQDRRLIYNTAMNLLRHGQPVPDSFFVKYAALDQYRSQLYSDLKRLKKLDKFPARYKNQSDMVRSMLTSRFRYDKIDTLVYIDKLPVNYENKKGFVYFFKYRRMPDDVVWQIASVGMQPENQTEIDLKNNDFTEREERKLDNTKPVKEQLQQFLKEMLYSRRESASMFYEARMYSLYKTYLSEMVKQQRYRD